MSTVTLIVIQGSKVHFVQAHWRTVQSLLEHGFDGVFWQKREADWDEDLDAGYVLVDLNRQLLVNGQHAFRVPSEGWDVAEA